MDQVREMLGEPDVIEQRPGAGTQVDEGREVVIVVGVLKETDTLEPGTPTTP